MLSEAEHASTAELARECQASVATLRRHLEALVTIGLLEQVAAESDGMTTGRPAIRYSLSPSIRASVREVLIPE